MPNEKESCCTPIEEKCVVFYAFGRYRAKKKKKRYKSTLYTRTITTSMHRMYNRVYRIMYVQ